MSNKFIPGKILSTLTLKNGKSVIIRYPQWSDLTELTKFINELSIEDTYISYSREVITREQETNWLASIFVKMETGDGVYLVAADGDKIVASFAVSRSEKNMRRTKHIGNYGAAIAKEYRSLGLGYNISTVLIQEAQKNILGLKQLQLNVFGNNEHAQNLYKKLGFKECGRIPGGLLYKNQYYDDILMCLNLN